MTVCHRFDKLPPLISPQSNRVLLAHSNTREGNCPWFEGSLAVMNMLQMYYQCWLEVTKQQQYRDKWLTDETYF